jgi:hypothetical protein
MLAEVVVLEMLQSAAQVQEVLVVVVLELLVRQLVLMEQTEHQILVAVAAVVDKTQVPMAVLAAKAL